MFLPLIRLVLISSFLTGILFAPEISHSQSQVESSAKPPEEYWLLAEGRKRSLSLMQGDRVIKRFYPAAFGGAGVGVKKMQGDLITPQGDFQIVERRLQSRFQHFLALNYPSQPYIDRALQEKRISSNQAKSMQRNLSNGILPAQDTILGGHIGIHGVGKGDPETHRLLNWTGGCIAVSNSDLTELYPLTFKGMLVRIQP